VRGQVLRALDEVRRGLQRLHGLPAQRLYAVRARLILYEGYLLTMRLQPQAGCTLLRSGLAEARACRDISVLIGHCALAGLHGREGHFAEAFAELAEAERLMHIWDVPPVYYLAMITLAKCEIWLVQGRVDLAQAWLERLGQTYGEQAAASPEFHPQLSLHIALQQAVLEQVQQHLGAAEQRLRRLAEHGQATGGHLLSAHALGQLIGLLLDSGLAEEAGRLFPHALQAAAGGALQPFARLLASHPRWLAHQLAQSPAGDTREALQALLPCSAAIEYAAAPGELLSGRELAVLRLIAEGCSNQQISEQLFISLHTVKTHASHINSKLGVERRTQAVARAKDLGLLV